MKINNHFLDDPNLERIQCPKNNEKFGNGLPDTIIIHYTAGRDGLTSAEYLARDNVSASAHLVIDRKGKIFQLVPFDTVAWHAGVSEYGRRKGFNKFSIGIELDNVGVLEEAGDSYMAWFGKKYKKEDVILATHRNEKSPQYWHIYSEDQISICEEICQLLIEKHKIKSILGHEEISPMRKSDPGPAFPLDKLRNNLLFNNLRIDEFDVKSLTGKVSPEKLNIRSGPDINFETVANPLTEDTKVEIIGEQYDWYKVKTEITGWVSKEYIELSNV